MSTFANRFQITNYGDLIRLVFEDCHTGIEGIIVVNLVMRKSDVIELAEVIRKVTKEVK